MTQMPAAATVAVVDAPPVSRAATRPSRVRGGYLGLAVLLTATVLWGFWPSYYGPLLAGTTPARHWTLHLHGAIFTGWLGLLVLQALLAASGRVRLHRQIGAAGVAYGALVLLMGLVVTFVAPVLHVQSGRWTLDAAAAFVILPLGDMVLFAGFFGGAVAYRRKPEVHKRLVLAATIALAFAAVARALPEPSLTVLLVWLSPLLVAMAFDVYTRRRVHAINVLSLVVLLAAFVRVFIMETEGWRRIGRAILGPFL